VDLAVDRHRRRLHGRDELPRPDGVKAHAEHELVAERGVLARQPLFPDRLVEAGALVVNGGDQVVRQHLGLGGRLIIKKELQHDVAAPERPGRRDAVAVPVQRPAVRAPVRHAHDARRRAVPLQVLGAVARLRQGQTHLAHVADQLRLDLIEDRPQAARRLLRLVVGADVLAVGRAHRPMVLSTSARDSWRNFRCHRYGSPPWSGVGTIGRAGMPPDIPAGRNRTSTLPRFFFPARARDWKRPRLSTGWNRARRRAGLAPYWWYGAYEAVASMRNPPSTTWTAKLARRRPVSSSGFFPPRRRWRTMGSQGVPYGSTPRRNSSATSFSAAAPQTSARSWRKPDPSTRASCSRSPRIVMRPLLITPLTVSPPGTAAGSGRCPAPSARASSR